MPSKGKKRQSIPVLYDYFQSVQHVNFSKVEEPAPEKDRSARVSRTTKVLSERSRIQDGPCSKSGKEEKDSTNVVSTQKYYCIPDVVASGSSDLLAPGEGSSKLMQVKETYNVCETVTNRSNIITADSGNEMTLQSTNSHNTHSIEKNFHARNITRKTIVISKSMVRTRWSLSIYDA